MKEALLLVNTKASQTTGCAEQIEECLTRGGLRVRRARPAHGDECSHELAAQLEGADLLITAGGDGTVLCGVEAILHARGGQLPLGIIPLGTANNAARSLGIPISIPKACEIITAGHTLPMDLGEVNGKLFVSVVGLGFSTQVHEQTPAELKKKLGPFAYAAHALWLLLHRPPIFRARITSDEGTHHYRALQITVCNGRIYGGHMEMHREATLHDGLLDLSVVEGGKYIRGFLKALLPLRRRHRSPGLHLISTRELEIVCDPPMKFDVEGAGGVQTPAKFSVRPAALPVFAPRPA